MNKLRTCLILSDQ